MKQILSLILLCLASLSAYAQERYYNDTKTFVENGYTYQCDAAPVDIYVKLYNKDNSYIHVNRVNRYTNKALSEAELRVDPIVESPREIYEKAKTAIKEHLTTDQQNQMRQRRQSFIFTLYINPDTGNIADVDFEFLKRSFAATIPVSIYRAIEVSLKRDVHFTLTKAGKSQNYVFVFFDYEP